MTASPRADDCSTDLRDRFRGCLIGGAVGDALGAPVEFMARDSILRRFGSGGIQEYAPAYGRLGAVTDDTQMTLFTAEGLLQGYEAIRAGRDIDLIEAVAGAYGRWLVTQGKRNEALFEDFDEDSGDLIHHQALHSLRAPGNTCLRALEALAGPDDLPDNDSKGCGGVMRVAPVGLLYARIGDRLRRPCFRLAADIAGITHAHPSGQLPAGVLADVIARVLTGAGLAEAIGGAKELLRARPFHEETLAAIEHAETLSADRPADAQALTDLGLGWVAEEALAIALYCCLSTDDFHSAVTLAVNHGGDSDSTGAIAGNIMGAIHGVGAVPAHLMENLELAEEIQAIADRLAEVA